MSTLHALHYHTRDCAGLWDPEKTGEVSTRLEQHLTEASSPRFFSPLFLGPCGPLIIDDDDKTTMAATRLERNGNSVSGTGRGMEIR